jgi:hypothetical protein
MELVMQKFRRHQWWLVTVLITIPLAAWGAQITFAAGQPIRSADVNNNFNELYRAVAGLPLQVTIATATCDVSDAQSDCSCPGDSVPIGGGAAAGGTNVLNASQALPANAPTFWRTACADTVSGVRVTCLAPFAVCLRVR